MPKAYEKIPTTTLLPNSKFAKPVAPPELIHLNDSALSVLIDFAHINASTVSAHDLIMDPLLVEKVSNEHLLFVVDDNEHIIGIITADDIHGEKPYQIIQNNRIKRAEITVNMIMTHFNHVVCLELEQLFESKVSNVIATLIESRQHYALAVEKDPSGKGHLVRGFFWATLISQRLSNELSDQSHGLPFIDVQNEFRL